MFAQSILSNYSVQIESVAVQISELEAQLNALREHQKQLEAERQAISTLASAGESAIAQAQQFLTLANRANRVDLVEAFWEEMDAIRSSQSAIADLPSVEPTNEPIDEPVIEVLSEPVEEETDSTEEKQNNHTNGYHNLEDVKGLLENTSYGELRKLAKDRNLNPTGKKHELIERLLKDNLTWEEISN